MNPDKSFMTEQEISTCEKLGHLMKDIPGITALQIATAISHSKGNIDISYGVFNRISSYKIEKALYKEIFIKTNEVREILVEVNQRRLLSEIGPCSSSIN